MFVCGFCFWRFLFMFLVVIIVTIGMRFEGFAEAVLLSFGCFDTGCALDFVFSSCAA
jgi:hypothetical protein